MKRISSLKLGIKRLEKKFIIEIRVWVTYSVWVIVILVVRRVRATDAVKLAGITN